MADENRVYKVVLYDEKRRRKCDLIVMPDLGFTISLDTQGNPVASVFDCPQINPELYKMADVYHQEGLSLLPESTGSNGHYIRRMDEKISAQLRTYAEQHCLEAKIREILTTKDNFS